MIAGRCSKTVAFVAILALTTFGALATASAQPADIKAIDKAFQDHYARGNYPAAQIDARQLERLVKARFGADHANYAVALNRLGVVSSGNRASTEAEGLYKRALAIKEEALGAIPPAVRFLKLWQAQGKYTEAEDLLKTLNNLANVYQAQGKYSEAEGLLQARVGDQGAGSRCEPRPPWAVDRDPEPSQRVSSPGQVHEAEELYKRP